MKHAAVHHVCAFADLDAAWACMNVNALIEITSFAQLDAIAKTQARPTLDRRHPIHLQDQSIENASQRYTNNRRHIAKQQLNNLLNPITPNAFCLAAEIQTELIHQPVDS
jgi:hypothetical protein